MSVSLVGRRALSLAGRARSAVFGAWRWLRATWYLTLATFPTPSESKWHGMVEMAALLLRAMLSEEEHTSNPRSREATDRSLEQLGLHWTWRRAYWLASRPPFPPAVRSTLVQAFKTLDMPTTVTLDGPVVTSVTTRCPFLEQALSKSMGGRVCQAVCSDDSSLFRGVANGFPFLISYRADSMMGHGDPACVKQFTIVRPLNVTPPVRQALGGRWRRPRQGPRDL